MLQEEILDETDEYVNIHNRYIIFHFLFYALAFYSILVVCKL